MAFAPGDVVALKSSSHPMTVVTVDDDNVECVWLGEEGELFRETIPSIALESVSAGDADEEQDADDDAEDVEQEADEEEEEPKGKKRA